MSLSAKHALLGSALLFAGLPLCADEPPSEPAVASAPRYFVKCPGISNVPMTSDAEQALPLAQIATLSCGESVTLLSDHEGYTAMVRTAEGKEGYVARMYLTNATPASKPRPDAAAVPINANVQNGVVRWNASAPGCDQFVSNGRNVETVTANGITVQVALQDTGWKLLATIAVSNQSGTSVYVLPNLITLDELKPSLRNLREQNPANLAHNEVNHQLLRDAANAQPPHGSVNSRAGSSVALANISYRDSAAQDYLGSASEPGSPQAIAMKDINLSSGQKTAGVLWFARAPNAQDLSMRLSVGDLVFDFPFTFQPKK
jgi:hypothetical protein